MTGEIWIKYMGDHLKNSCRLLTITTVDAQMNTIDEYSRRFYLVLLVFNLVLSFIFIVCLILRPN